MRDRAFLCPVDFDYHNSLSNRQGKGIDLKRISSAIQTRTNTLFREYNITNVTQPLSKLNIDLDSSEFPDGSHIAISTIVPVLKVVSEGVAVTKNFLITTEIEPGVYRTDSDHTIKIPGLGTGTFEAMGTKLSDLTSLGILAYNLVFDEPTQDGFINSFYTIKEKVTEDKTQVIPILKEAALSVLTGTSSAEYQEIQSSTTDQGRKSHLVSRAGVSTGMTVMMGAKILTELPRAIEKCVIKFKYGKKMLTFTNLKGVSAEALQSFRKKIDELGADAEKFFADFEKASPEDLKKILEGELVDSWKRLDGLGRAQMKKDPSILTSVRKAMDNPDIPSDKLDNIINKLAESGARCKTCDTPGKIDLRFVDEVLDDLDGFATEFKNTPGFSGFLNEMGQTGKKATGGSWTLDALMKNRSKYFGSEMITGFEIKHVPGRDFAADVVSKNGDKLIYNEFKSWSSNLMGQSNMIDQMTGTLTQINNLDETRFIFDANRWVPDAAKLKTALQGKSGLFDAIPDAKKLELFQTIDTQEIINILADDDVFSVIFKVQ